MAVDLNLEILARHEAGHAAVALAIGAPVLQVRVRRPNSGCQIPDGWEESSKTHAGAALVFALSGAAAQYVRWPHSYPDGARSWVSTSDLQLAVKCAAQLAEGWDGFDYDFLFNHAWGEAIRVLRLPQVEGLVSVIAAELLRCGKIEGSRVRELGLQAGINP